MRKVFIIIIQIIILIVVLRTDFAKQFFGDIATYIVNGYESIIDVPERRKIRSLQDKFMRNNMALQPHQTDYVFTITESAESVAEFHQLYCVKRDKNPYIFGKNLTKLCENIVSSELLVSTGL